MGAGMRQHDPRSLIGRVPTSWTSPTPPPTPPTGRGSATGSRRNAGEYRDAARYVPYPQAEWVARSRAWQKAKHAAGYTGITWPTAMGGQGLSARCTAIIFNQEQSRYHAPTELFAIGLGMCLPDGVHPRQRRRSSRVTSPPRSRATRCGASCSPNPPPGSDLAGIRTKAVRDGDAPDRSPGQATGSSTGRRCGRRTRICPTMASSSLAPIRASPSTRG